MKIGILTYHRLVNRGSVLQAYCLQKFLGATFPGSAVEVVDYSTLKMELLPIYRSLRRQPPYLVDLHEVGELRRMRRFVARHLTLSGTSLRSDSTTRAMKWLARQGYDAVIVGSDVVWEIQPRGYSLGGVNTYHQPMETGYVKASFAVSMDPVVVYPAKLRPKLRAMAEHVGRFDFISVRDEATKGVLVEHGVDDERIHYLPDPTLLVDFPELVGEAPWPKGERPVLAVDIKEELARPIHAVARRAGYEVWDWRRFSGPDVDRASSLDLSVDQVLGLYRQVDVLVSDRFHGMILASRLGRAGVVFIEHERKWPLPNSKGRDLLRRVGLGSCVLRVGSAGVAPVQLDECIATALSTAGLLHDGLARLAGADSAAAVAELKRVIAAPRPAG